MGNVNVDTQNPLYALNAPEWRTIRDCIAGERAVKAAGPRYLPHPSSYDPNDAKEVKRYRAYKQRAVFLNATARTLNAMLGVAFAKPVAINLKSPLAMLQDDCDGEGTPLTQVLRGALSEVLQSGRGGFLVDYSRQAAFDENGVVIPQTAAEMAENRPTVKWYCADQIINWRASNGKDTLIVLKELTDLTTNETDDFAINEVTVWTELRIVNGKAFARKWYYNTQAQDINTDLPRGMSKTDLVPVVDFTGKQMTDLPFCWCGATDNNASPDVAPMGDIAQINIKHYVAEADLAEIAHIVGQPTLVASGLTQAWVDKNMKGGIGLGATKGLLLGQNMDAKLIQAEERNLSLNLCERREQQMSKLGAALVEKGTAPKTATEANFDAQTDNSILALVAGNVESAFNRALTIAQSYIGGADESTVVINKVYAAPNLDPALFTAMMSGVQLGTIRLADFIKWLMGQGIVDDSESVEQVETELRNQEPLPTMTQPEPDPNAEDQNNAEEQ